MDGVGWLMSRSAEVDIDWADGTYRFRLAWGQLMELQEKCDAGPWYILAQLQGLAVMTLYPEAVRGLRIEYIAETIRLGLIGGGVTPVDALHLVRRYVHERPPSESAGTALSILQAALSGAADEPPGKPGEGETTPRTSPVESSGSPGSSEAELSSD